MMDWIVYVIGGAWVVREALPLVFRRKKNDTTWYTVRDVLIDMESGFTPIDLQHLCSRGEVALFSACVEAGFVVVPKQESHRYQLTELGRMRITSEAK